MNGPALPTGGLPHMLTMVNELISHSRHFGDQEAM